MSDTITDPKASAKAGTASKANGTGEKDKAPAKRTQERVPVLKTYKLYIGGKFPRTESGRYYQPKDAAGKPLANVCQGSRKDLRMAVVAARKAFAGWSGRSAYNRGQVLYRVGEMLEGRSEQFISELMRHGVAREQAMQEVHTAIDRWIHYAGWCDKYQAVFSSVNPVSTDHFNFSMQEPTGVVGVMSSNSTGFIELISLIAPVITGGNTCVAVASEQLPLPAITLAEVLATSDLPGGVVNLITGYRKELAKPMVTHMDINAVVVAGADQEERRTIDFKATDNLKRIIYRDVADWNSDQGQSPYFIVDSQEVKTTWHPIERGQTPGSSY